MRKSTGILFALLLCFLQCKEPPNRTSRYLSMQGRTMGTTYSVTYAEPESQIDQVSVDALLVRINDALSTYIPQSLISRINQAEEGFDLDGEEMTLIEYFVENYLEADRIHQLSEGYFDPTVGSLVEMWGFGVQGRPEDLADSSEVLKVLEKVGMQKVKIDSSERPGKISKAPGVQLDFSALAKGYGVDKVCEFLEANGCRDYLVEIGGEVRVAGLSPRGEKWMLGINVPEERASQAAIYSRTCLTNRAMATSGNYRNFFVIDGKKVWHSINPKTGFPEENRMLSATIVAPQCMTADALATACMVGGLDLALQMIAESQDIEGYFIFEANDGAMRDTMTAGFAAYLPDLNTN